MFEAGGDCGIWGAGKGVSEELGNEIKKEQSCTDISCPLYFITIHFLISY
ncbi:MAG: hypothetical protein H8E71_00160 [Candidatus Marinimicrobia bacterium]|nr:hypothetical protein [Candidatus Neomarinimicrobiota bacterium]